MNVSGREVFIAVAFLVVGWVLHMLWDVFMDWLAQFFDGAGGLLWNLFAIVGVVAVCLAIGFGVTHGWFTNST